MAHSNLLGGDEVPVLPAGHDTAGAHEAADIGPDTIIRGPDADPDIDDKRPLFEDYPEEDEVGNEDYVDNLPPEDEESDSLDYNNAVFRRRESDMP